MPTRRTQTAAIGGRAISLMVVFASPARRETHGRSLVAIRIAHFGHRWYGHSLLATTYRVPTAHSLRTLSANYIGQIRVPPSFLLPSTKRTDSEHESRGQQVWRSNIGEALSYGWRVTAAPAG
jgi:hypothetical protein